MYPVRLILLVALIAGGFRADAEKLLLKSDEVCKIWWAGSTCKIMRDDPVPVKTGEVKISSAKNETESFQLVLTPLVNLKALTATVSDFRKEGVQVIPSKNVVIRNVEYVHVSKPSVTGREGRCTDLIEIDPTRPYVLKWQAKTLSEKQKYTVTVHCYDENKKPVYWSLKWMVSEGGKNWQQDSLYIDPEKYFSFEGLPDYRPFPENARYAEVRLYAGLPEKDGYPGGT